MTIEKDLSYAEFEKSGISPEDDQFNQLIDSLGLERVEGFEKRTTIEDCIVGNLEGANAKNDFKINRKYIDNQEALFIMSLGDFGLSSFEQNCFLMQIHDRTMNRAKNKELPSNSIDRELLSDLMDSIKVNFIMNFNEVVTNYIENSKGGKLQQISLSHLQSIMAQNLAEASAYYNRNLSLNLKNIDRNFGTDHYEIEIEKIIEGMRHQAGFRDLIDVLNDGTIEISEEVTRLQDSHGFDFILNVRVAEELKNDKYVYASNDDIERGSYYEIDLPIDIKSNINDAGKTLLDMTKDEDSAYGIDHWVLWSHLYPQDFKLAIEKDGTVDLGGKEDEAILFLKSSHIFAMRDLSNINYYDYHYKENFTPESLKQRLDDIKKEVLRGINAVYNRDSVVA